MVLNLRCLSAIGLICSLLLTGCGSKNTSDDPTVSSTGQGSSSSKSVFSSEPMVKGDQSSSGASKDSQSNIVTDGDNPEGILKSIYAQSNKLDLCEGDLQQGVSQEVSQVYALGGDSYIAEVLCFMAAYQGSYEYVLYKGDQLKRLPFSIFDEEGEQLKVLNLAGLPTYDPSSKTLEIFTKGRGLGDCGSLAQYKFDGNNFNLVEYRAKNECDGQYIEPDQYPVVFPGGSKTKDNQSKADKKDKTLPSPIDGDGTRKIDATYVLNYVKQQQPAIGSCAPATDEQYDIYQISDQSYLVQALCETYAYQSEYQFLKYTGGSNEQIEVLSFIDFSEDPQGNFNQIEANFLVGMTSYDPSQGALTVFSKFNGAGTCGSLSTYQWSGSAFELQQFQAKTDCEGDYIDPSSYPVIYP